MTNYLLRAETGEVTAELPSEVGVELLTNLAGEWSSVNYPNGLPVQRFTLKEGRVLELSNGDFKLTLMIWKGMMLDLTDLTNTPYANKR